MAGQMAAALYVDEVLTKKAPELGADTDAILAEIGMNAQDIKELHEQGVV